MAARESYNLFMNAIADVAEVFQGLARSGRGAGARPGQWTLRIVESTDVRGDGWLEVASLREIGIVQNSRTERHLLRPFDVLVTARAASVQVAIVPPNVSRTVAGVTLLVVRPRSPESGMGHWLWYFLASTHGRSLLAKRMTVNASLSSISARNLAEVQIPVPSGPELDRMARLVEASEAARAAARQAAALRHETLRDSLVQRFSGSVPGTR
ncbi:MAG: hypothetical protein OXG43_05000 [Chloroflexi bacterium]|nr:hypothetical protein [Chloroflexota bacterium]